MNEREKIEYATRLCRVGLLRSGAIRQSCVASGALVTEVLRRLDIPARPMTASVVAGTAQWAKRVEAGNLPAMDEWDRVWEEERVASVGVAYDPTPSEGAWTGHLIVLGGAGQRYLIDPSLDQLARPDKGMPLIPAVVDMAEGEGIDHHEFRRGRTQAITHWDVSDQEAATLIGVSGVVVIWSCFPADRSYRTLNDFTLFEYRYGSMARSIVDVIREMDEAGLTGDALPDLPEIPDAPDDPSLIARPRTREELARTRMSAH
jgi:hypothetical protein